MDAELDLLQSPAGPRPAWSSVWQRLVDIELDRGQRVLAWRILHGSVLCGALRAYVGRTDAAGAVCPHVCCAGALQTLSHLFLACPLADGVWRWLFEVWVRVSGDLPPPLAASVLLADDDSVWQPSAELRPLWTRLRLATLHALWCAAGKARQGSGPTSVRTIAASVVASCRQLMISHWFRVGLHRAALGVCPQWLLSRDPSLSTPQFTDWWCARGVLCRVIVYAGSRPKMQILFSDTHPVPLPD